MDKFVMAEDNLLNFYLSFTGVIENAKFAGGISDEELYIRYELVYGEDWEIISGLTGGISQLASIGRDPEYVVFNIPVEANFKSANVTGWPQMVVSVHGISKIGIEGIRGYGRAHIPTLLGHTSIDIPLICPRSNTWLGEWLAWLTGRHPELVSPAILASGKENYLMRTQSYGCVNVKLSVISKQLHRLGYDNGSEKTS